MNFNIFHNKPLLQLIVADFNLAVHNYCMKIPTLKALFEFAFKQKKEQLAPKRSVDIVGYDKKLDDLYSDEEPEPDGSDLKIHSIG